MNSLANSLSQTPGSERLPQAEAWAKKAIAVIDSAKASERDPEVIGQCEAVLLAALFNMGSLREVGRRSGLWRVSLTLSYCADGRCIGGGQGVVQIKP